MSINIALAKPHIQQLSDKNVKEEVDSISEFINNSNFIYQENTINFVFIKGFYNHIERKMITIGLFVNKTEYSMQAMRGSLELNFKKDQAKIATTTFDFDESFCPVLKPDDALLVHMGIPVKGLLEDKEITYDEISGHLKNLETRPLVI